MVNKIWQQEIKILNERFLNESHFKKVHGKLGLVWLVLWIENLVHGIHLEIMFCRKHEKLKIHLQMVKILQMKSFGTDYI